MSARNSFALILVTGLGALAVGCQSTIYNLRIPVGAGAAGKAGDPDPRVVIEDVRPEKERRPHLGKEIRSCERWFGDQTIEPPKLSLLAAQVAEWTRADMPIRIVLRRFEIVEYCEFTSVGAGTGAAQSSFTPAPANGDTVVIRLSGTVNGIPFDLESRFDYGAMYRFPNLPSSSPQYREQLRLRLAQLCKEIANLVWQAEMSRNAHAGN
jgi:hypothetical protein